MQKYTIYFFFIILFASCNKLENKVHGVWVIEQAYYFNKPVIWNLYSNGIILHDNNTCNLPISNIEHKHSKKENGKWKAFNEGSESYIQINTSNKIFNRTFKILSLEKVKQKNDAYLLKMTLISDSLKLDCSKALYK